MKSYTTHLTFNTTKRREIINITDKVEKAILDSGIKEGLCLVSAMHITASVFINDDESGLKEDILEWLEEVAPDKEYMHHRTGEDNGCAHLRNLLIGHQVVVPVTSGKRETGPWQQIFYGEWDGQRPKRVLVKVIGE